MGAKIAGVTIWWGGGLTKIWARRNTKELNMNGENAPFVEILIHKRQNNGYSNCGLVLKG